MRSVKKFNFSATEDGSRSMFSDGVLVTGKMTIVGFNLPNATEYGFQLIHTPERELPKPCDCEPYVYKANLLVLEDLTCPRYCDTLSNTKLLLSKEKPTLVIDEYVGYTIRIVRLSGDEGGVITYTMEGVEDGSK